MSALVARSLLARHATRLVAPVLLRRSATASMSVTHSLSRGGPQPCSLRVVTYNVLSSHLGAADYFTSCAPANLVPAVRLQRVLEKLEGEVQRGACSLFGSLRAADSRRTCRLGDLPSRVRTLPTTAGRRIPCLISPLASTDASPPYRVSMSWYGPLTTFFAQRGFTFLSRAFPPQPPPAASAARTSLTLSSAHARSQTCTARLSTTVRARSAMQCRAARCRAALAGPTQSQGAADA